MGDKSKVLYWAAGDSEPKVYQGKTHAPRSVHHTDTLIQGQ